MSRISDSIEIVKHKIAFMKVRKSNEYLLKNISLTRALMHDTGKAINILLLGDSIATWIHRQLAGHHQEESMNKYQKAEAFCDWECARYTKPDKPLDGYETWHEYYKHVDMREVVEKFYK